MAWWREFFGREYVEAWTAAGVFERTETEADGLDRLLDLHAGARVLDVPCGFGRIAGALHGRGLEVLGMDASPEQIDLARERYPGPAYVVGDMREPPEGPFDGVVNIFSSFGYFDDPAEDARALRAWHGVLRPAGVLVMELNHRDHVARHFTPVRGDVVREESSVDWVAGMVESTVHHGDWKGTFRVRLYTATELVRMLREIGFSEVEAFGDFERGPVSPDTRLVLRAVR